MCSFLNANSNQRLQFKDKKCLTFELYYRIKREKDVKGHSLNLIKGHEMKYECCYYHHQQSGKIL